MNPLLLLMVFAFICMPQMPGVNARTYRIPPAIVLELQCTVESGNYIELETDFTTKDYYPENGKLILIPTGIEKIPGESRGWPYGSGSNIIEYELFMN